MHFRSKLKHEERYAASMELKTPRSDLLTFGFMGRDYKKDTDSLDLFNTLLHRYLEFRAASRNNEISSNDNQTQSNASR